MRRISTRIVEMADVVLDFLHDIVSASWVLLLLVVSEQSLNGHLVVVLGHLLRNGCRLVRSILLKHLLALLPHLVEIKARRVLLHMISGVAHAWWLADSSRSDLLRINCIDTRFAWLQVSVEIGDLGHR